MNEAQLEQLDEESVCSNLKLAPAVYLEAEYWRKKDLKLVVQDRHY